MVKTYEMQCEGCGVYSNGCGNKLQPAESAAAAAAAASVSAVKCQIRHVIAYTQCCVGRTMKSRRCQMPGPLLSNQLWQCFAYLRPSLFLSGFVRPHCLEFKQLTQQPTHSHTHTRWLAHTCGSGRVGCPL